MKLQNLKRPEQLLAAAASKPSAAVELPRKASTNIFKINEYRTKNGTFETLTLSSCSFFLACCFISSAAFACLAFSNAGCCKNISNSKRPITLLFKRKSEPLLSLEPPCRGSCFDQLLDWLASSQQRRAGTEGQQVPTILPTWQRCV